MLPQASCTLETVLHAQPAPNGAGVQGPWTPLDPSTDHGCRRNDRLTHRLQESSSQGHSLRKGPALGGRHGLWTVSKAADTPVGKRHRVKTLPPLLISVSCLPSFPKLIRPRPGSCCLSVQRSSPLMTAGSQPRAESSRQFWLTALCEGSVVPP